VFVASLKQLILPTMTLAIFSLAPIAACARLNAGGAGSDSYAPHRASGLSPATVIVTYAFRTR